MAAEVVKQWKELKQKKEKAEVRVTENQEELKKAAVEIKELKAERARCMKERRQAEKDALQNEKDILALKMEMLAVQKDISVCEVELEELNWEYSRVFFSGVKRKKISEQLKEKKAVMATHQEKLKELRGRRDAQKALPRYLETIAQHTEIRQSIGKKSDEMLAHMEFIRNQQDILQKEISKLETELVPMDEQIERMLASGELTEEERDRILAEEEPEAAEAVEKPAESEEDVIVKSSREETSSARDAEASDGDGLSIRNVRRPDEPKLSIRNVGRPGGKQAKGPLYEPGEEPEGIKEQIDEVIEKLEEFYPDHIVVGLHADHKQLGKKVTELYRLLKYENGNDFLKAYGFTVKRKRPWGS